MILVRLKKVALNNNLSYSIVVSSNKISPNSNKFIEKIGFYRPLVDKLSNKYIFIDVDRLLFWLKRGAKINASVFVLIKPLIVNTLKTLK